MIPKKPAPDLIRGGNRFSDKIMLKQNGRSQQHNTGADALADAMGVRYSVPDRIAEFH
jgi:hypothetical protein